jgi:hypothetical protein
MRTTDATQPFRDWTVLEAPRRWERRMSVRLEEHTANLPSVVLGAAVMALGVAIVLLLSGTTPAGLFIALWAAPYLLLGICSKLVNAGHLEPGNQAKVGEMHDRAPAATDRRQ